MKKIIRIMIDPLFNRLKKISPLYKTYRFIFRRNTSIHDSDNFPDISIKRDDILNISNKYKFADTFIETGTLFGDTIEYFKNKFVKLYSIELSEELANKAIERFSIDHHIQIVQGNSADMLGPILKEINTGCIFWLDGHYSSEFWAGNKYIKTAKGDKNTPILQELNLIVNHHVGNHIILIDDAQLFSGQNDYPSIAKVKRFVSKKLPTHSFEIANDIIRILPIK